MSVANTCVYGSFGKGWSRAGPSLNSGWRGTLHLLQYTPCTSIHQAANAIDEMLSAEVAANRYCCILRSMLEVEKTTQWCSTMTDKGPAGRCIQAPSCPYISYTVLL